MDSISEKGFIEDFLAKNENIFPYSITAAFIIIMLIFEKVGNRIYKLFTCCLVENNELKDFKLYEDCYREISYYSLPNYNMALNPKYRTLLKLKLTKFYKLKQFLRAGPSLQKIIKTENFID